MPTLEYEGLTNAKQATEKKDPAKDPSPSRDTYWWFTSEDGDINEKRGKCFKREQLENQSRAKLLGKLGKPWNTSTKLVLFEILLTTSSVKWKMQHHAIL